VKIHTELVGGIYDGKRIELDGKTLPMVVEVPYFPDMRALLDVAYQVPSDNPEEPLVPYRMATYTLNNDGTYRSTEREL
jgi:hypothetical protein